MSDRTPPDRRHQRETAPTPPAGGAVTVIDCPACTTADSHPADPHTANRDAGATECRSCGGHGRRRAQLVLTVANIDTAAVASATVTPGAITPTRDADNLFWCLDTAPVVARLADQVAATHLYEPDLPDDPIFAPWTDLPEDWRPDLPAELRLAYETRAIADEARDPWQIWLARSTPPPSADPARRLSHLCDVAELLCLDLVVEARRLTPGDRILGWDLRFELPGSPLGDRVAPWSDLAEAAVMTTVSRAAAHLADQGRHAPAHHVLPRAGTTNGHPRPAGVDGHPGGIDTVSIGPPRVDVDQLERRILADCTALLTGGPTPGAHAVWRDGRWWHTTLRTTSTPAGQPVTTRARQPPPPSWQGPPIPYAACPDCPPTPDLARCRCPRIGGCRTCHGTHRVFHATTVTIYDGHHRARHLTWQAPHPGDQLRTQLTALGLDPEDIAPLADQDRTHLTTVTSGQPAGRILVHATPPPAPPLATMVTLMHALGLHVVVSVTDHRADTGATPHPVQGLRWGVRVAPPDADVDLPRWVPEAQHRTVGQAVDHALRYLRDASDRAVPTDPAAPIPTPTDTAGNPTNAGDHCVVTGPTGVLADDADPIALLTALAARYPGVTVTVLLTPDRCEIHPPTAPADRDGGIRAHLHTRVDARDVVIAAATLAEAVDATA